MDVILDRLKPALADRYALDRELGRGGMATVYLAEDLRHDRKVAIKVFQPELSALLGADRFLQEIKVTAHLQHPHILPLYDSGSADGLLYYVMPFVEGEALRARLSREKQLPVPDAVGIARAVAAALDYAHRHGVIHRDIKPENILLHEGQALVADFGIALAVRQAGGDRLTQTGLSLGTPSYMSPEQATGDRVLDGRADIYALGAMTYEMLTGDPPHTGSSAQAVIAKIVTETPARVTSARPSVPAHVEAAVLQALAKLPADRFATAGAFAEALERPGFTTAATSFAPGVRRAPWWVLAAAGTAMLAAGALGGRFLFTAGAPAPERVARLTVEVSGLGFNPIRTMALSQDGQSVVFYNDAVAAPTLRLRRLSELTDASIPGVDGGVNPAISPNGRRLLYTWQSRTFAIDVQGGQAALVPGVEEGAFMIWADDESIAYEGTDGGAWIAPAASSGTPRRVASPDTSAGERALRPLDVLPGGDAILVLISPGTGPVGPVDAIALRDGRRTRVLGNPVRGAWYAGHETLVYAALDGLLYGIAFDPDRLTVRGSPVPLGGPAASSAPGLSRVVTSRRGDVLYAPVTEAELVQIDRAGGVRPLLTSKTNYHNPRYAPDGRRIAYDMTDADGRDVWVHSLADGTLARATFENDGHDAIWSADGRSLVYVGTLSGGVQLLRRRLDGTPPVTLADAARGGIASPAGMLADSNLLVVGTPRPESAGWDILHVTPSGTIQPALATRFMEAYADPSRDGRWIAYVSNESRRQEVYVRPAVGEGTRLQVSTDGGTEPRWSARGDELFYIRTGSGQPELISARLELGREPKVTSRQTLFPWREFEPAEPHGNYDVAPDGKSFVAVRRSAGSKLILIQNVQQLVHGGGAR